MDVKRNRTRILFIWAVLSFGACSGFETYRGEAAGILPAPASAYQSVDAPFSIRMLALSDIHGYDRKTLVLNEAVQRRHMFFWGKTQDTSFEKTRRILESAGRQQGIDFVVIAGDLTVDGEEASHRLLSEILSDFELTGIPVFVTTGNHDVNNPYASKHGKHLTVPVTNVGPSAFAEIYAEFGFSEAIARDAVTLSYAAEPQPGILLLMLDTSRWDENRGFPFPRSVEGGAVRADTLEWAERVLSSARDAGKTIIAVQHHPLDDAADLYDLYRRFGVALSVSGHRHLFGEALEDPVPRVAAPSIAASETNPLLIELDRDGIRVARNPFRFVDR